jgi:hypothetical protein
VFEALDASIERNQDCERRQHRACCPDDWNRRARGTPLGEETSAAEKDGEKQPEYEMQRDIG